MRFRQAVTTLFAILAAGALGAADGVGLSVVLEARAAAQRGQDLLLTQQRGDGSWAGDPLTTAQVLICLQNAPDPAGEARRSAAVAPAVAYLRRTVAAPPLAADALAAVLLALGRAGIAAHRDLLASGRARLLGCARPLDLPEGRRGLAFAACPDGPPDPWVTCAGLDGLLVTSGLEPAWTRAEYDALTAYLRVAAPALPGAAPLPVAGPSQVAAPAVASGQAALAAARVRALLCLGVNPADPDVAGPLARLAQAPSRDPAAAFALAEALSLARADSGPLAGWRTRVIEVLLDAQQSDGGWSAATGAGPRDGATALALRAIQVAAGRQLTDTDPALP